MLIPLVKLGFHGHDNLGMALANTLTAIEEGVDIVDATVTGMGRGAGNLRTELLLTVLHKFLHQSPEYLLQCLFWYYLYFD